jgi:hypothetical protein
MNFFTEMKKCGDELYRRAQFWEFVSIDGHPEYVDILSAALSLPTTFISRQRGAWLVNITKHGTEMPQLTTEDQKSLDEQIDAMIQTKYISIHYNGLNRARLDVLTQNGAINPFHNSVVIVDEAHNFVSRIVNKLNRRDSISYQLYQYLMDAHNARIVFLSGTPIINRPNEISVAFNILRGYITTWTIALKDPAGRKLTENSFLTMFREESFKAHDYVSYSGNKLTITRNPFGFSNMRKSSKDAAAAGVAADEVAFQSYSGVALDEHAAALTDNEFLARILAILTKKGFQVPPLDAVVKEQHMALPDKADDFLNKFVDPAGNVTNINIFKKRILGLTSYFRSAQEKLMPRFNKHADLHVVECPMSDYQFGIYATARRAEREREKIKKRSGKKVAAAGVDPNEIFKEVSSTYRVMSRAFCNFVFPEGMTRPVPEHGTGAAAATADGVLEGLDPLDEDDLDAVSIAERLDNPDGKYTEDDVEELKGAHRRVDPTYVRRIAKILEDLKTRAGQYLTQEALMTYSPKFLHILDNIRDDNHIGLHLFYSTFRTVEGIGIMKLVLEQNGFAEFKIHKHVNGTWEIVSTEDDAGKPRFALYTGTETAEEKEILRNIYNGAFDNIPYSLAEKVREIASNNMYGEIIKVFMITAAGSEGINLINTRYVHICEPFWHPARTEQVIGRARRICSHSKLPEELRTVSVFLYLATFTEPQKTGDIDIELREQDRSKEGNLVITTDEYLYEISNIKERINEQILRAIKETSMDCTLYNRKLATENGERLVCYGFGNIKTNAFGSFPTLDEDENVAEVGDLNVKKVEWKAKAITIRGTKYALRDKTDDIYDLGDFKVAQSTGMDIFPIGKLQRDAGGKITGVEFSGAK